MVVNSLVKGINKIIKTIKSSKQNKKNKKKKTNKKSKVLNKTMMISNSRNKLLQK